MQICISGPFVEVMLVELSEDNDISSYYVRNKAKTYG